MATSPLNQKSHFHARSNSFPSRPHPLLLQCNEHLCSLSASNSVSSSSSSFMSQNLSSLQDLHECVEKLFQLPLTQQSIAQDCGEKWVDELLNGSLGLIDACTAAKDALLHTKECSRELQSVIRRRRGGEKELAAEIKKYLTSRKVVRKAARKALSNMKSTENKFSSVNKDHQNLALVSLLREVEVVTLSVFESLLSFISGTTQSKPSNWFLVSKLMPSKRVASVQEIDANEFTEVDTALEAFTFCLNGKSDHHFSHLQKQLENQDSCNQDLEEGLETLCRRLIWGRVSLLNILNHCCCHNWM